MKPEELMLGDLVYYVDKDYDIKKSCKIISISDYDWLAQLPSGGKIGGSNSNGCPLEECLEPIPLTIEILEKNWHGSGLGWYDVFMMWKGEYDEHNWATRFFAVRDAYRYPHLSRFSIIKDDKDNVIKEIKYVHELQHWLKVLGIEKEVVV